jgi:predicted ATPase
MQAKIEFEGDNSTTTYTIRFADAAPDTLIFTDERILFQKTGFRQPQDILLGAGHKESLLKEKDQAGDQTCKVLYGMLSRCRSYQFHDTSSTAGIRKSGYIEDAAYLRSDAGNLPTRIIFSSIGRKKDTRITCSDHISCRMELCDSWR